MQQTEKYKLNLIESSDPFLPDALNANTQKMEDVLSAAIEEHRTETDARLTALEAHRIYVGSYKGVEASSLFVPLPFTPRVVMTNDYDSAHGGPHFWIAVNGQYEPGYLKIQENGFTVSGLLRQGTNYTYPFLALV